MRKTILGVLTLAVIAALTTPATAKQAGSGQSQFGRMFSAQTSNATAQELADLAQLQFDPNADADNNPTGLLSGNTYLGQFIDHDLTLDTSPSPTSTVDPTTLVNHRAFSFDLDSVYGGGPAVSPQLYATDHKHFLVQEPNGNGVRDLPRSADGHAVLVEGRNDENQIIAQIHVAVLKFHNAQVNRGLSFTAARMVTIAAYRYVVLHEFLPHLVGQPMIDQVKADGMRGKGFYDPGGRKEPMTPVEFSVAAYRFGHSQVRRAYRLNGTNNCQNLQVFNLANPDASLMGGRPIQAGRQIAWGQFVAGLPQPAECAALPGISLNVSRKIDPLLSSSLFQLPIPGAEAAGSNVLGFRNMIRAKFYDMPSGQTVARAMGLTPIPGAELLPATIPTTGNGSVPEERQPALRAAFAVDTPLWYYILAESNRVTDGARLGPVGGRIVTEVFLDVLGRFTFAPPPGQPSSFGFADFLRIAGVT